MQTHLTAISLFVAASLAAVVVAGFAFRKAYGPRNLLGKYQGIILCGIAVVVICMIFLSRQ